MRLWRWIELGRAIGAQRLLLDGSFVTNKPEPGDVDAVMFVPANFSRLVAQGVEAALELEEMFLTRQPQKTFSRRRSSGLARLVRVLQPHS